MPARPRLASSRGRLIAVGVVVIAAGATALAVNLKSSPTGRGASATTPVRSVPTTTSAPVPVTVTSIAPSGGTTGIPLHAQIAIHFNEALSTASSKPVLSPAVQGSWSEPRDNELVFTPSGLLAPDEAITVRIPAGEAGVVALNGGTLLSPFTTHFTTLTPSTTRFQQLLAELNYLPVAFEATTPATAGTGTNVSAINAAAASTEASSAAPTSTAALDAEATSPESVSLSATPGHFVWRFPHIPSQLAATWSPGLWNVATQGAVMAFESAQNLPVDGEVGPAVWQALLTAVAKREVNTAPYDYLIVTETVPETLYVWRDGKVILQTPANTGVEGAATALGTFPVYLRYVSTTMSGTNPDGSHYSDPGVPWVSYFNGSDAVHGFVRPGYGVPQSDGCVELPIPTSAEVYPMDNYGTLVTVTTGNLTAELDAAPPVTTGVFAASAPATPTPTPTTTSTTTTTVPPVHHPAPTTTTTTSTTTTTTTTTPPVTTTTATTTP